MALRETDALRSETIQGRGVCTAAGAAHCVRTELICHDKKNVRSFFLHLNQLPRLFVI